jgi:hypothetical protein
METLSELLLSVLADFSLSGLPSDVDVAAMTDTQQADLHQALHDVVIAFRERSRLAIESLRVEAQPGPARPSNPAPAAPPARAIARQSVRTGAASALSRPKALPQADAFLASDPSLTGELDNRIREIDREIANLSRRYRNLGTGWRRVREIRR